MRNKILIGIGILVVIAGVGYGAFLRGVTYGAQFKSIKITDSRQLLDADFSTFWEAVDVVKENYIGIKDVKDKDMLEGAISGMVGALNDPYTTFFNRSDAQKFDQDLSGSFGGIGARIDVKDDQIIIVAPLKDTPAYKAGLKAGDKILKIDDELTTNMDVDAAVKIIRGKEGTEVSLLILRDGWEDPKTFKLMREIINVPTLEWEMVDLASSTVSNGNEVKTQAALIRLYNFNINALGLFSTAVSRIAAEDPRGIIIDLRDNPGGYLDVAVGIGSLLLSPGEVVVQENMSGKALEILKSDGPGMFQDIPVVVIVNSGSASASEILAGALRDVRNAKLVGETTFGKGSVQEIKELSDGATIKVTIAEWLTPKGTHINKKGLAPDFTVKISDSDAKNGRDPQLSKAIQVLKSQLGIK
ncbi:MAG: S41 family peptidase [Candidatus Jorgensenbacteria bacterium]|nr:S41 family peptidase [Candidatus Jorgensenbacteria bacterium]